MPDPVSLEDVKGHPLFVQLTPRQQAFVTHYCETQDKVAAIRAAGYQCKSDQTADMMARKNLKHAVIKQLVAIGLGYEPTGGILSKKEVLLLMSDRLRENPNATVFSRLIWLFSQLRGWTNANDVPDLAHAIRTLERRRKK